MKSSSTDIIIIGAGIAGLAAGCYAQMNGYRTQIFEMHSVVNIFGLGALITWLFSKRRTRSAV